MTQRGFTMISAIFLLVILAALGAFIVTVSTMSQTSSAMDVLSARAYQAARSGIEWGVYQVNSSNGFNASSPNTRLCSFSQGNLNIPVTASTLTPFTVTVSCTPPYIDPNGGPTVYEVTATACNKPSATGCPGTPGLNYVERRLKVSF